MAVYYKGREINEIDYVKVEQGGSESGNLFETIGYNLTPKYIQDGIDYAKTIYDNWDATKTDRGEDFNNDKKLIYFPSVDTSNVTNMYRMFYNCSNLQFVPYLDTSKSNGFNQIFWGCDSLISLDLSNWNTSNVTNMYAMFNSCKSLTELDLSNWDTSKVTNMSSMFGFCSGLTRLDLSNWDTSKVTNMSQMLYYCSSLTELDLTGLDTSKVTNMNQMLSNCSGLTELDLSNWDTSKVTSMNTMFGYNSGLIELDLTGWDTSNVSNMSYMFSGCHKLQRIDGYLDWTKISSYPTNFITSNSSNGYPLRYMTIKNLGTTGTTFNFNNTHLQNWGDESDTTTYPLSVGARQSLVDSLLTYSYDRAANGLSNATIQLHSKVKARLTADEITAIQNKGYTIS